MSLVHGPMMQILSRRTARTVLGIMALISVIFIAESFTTLLSNVLDNDASAWRLALLLTLKMPEIVDFALPLALTLGVYFALTGARDDNELVVCAAAGTSWLVIPLFAFWVGLIGLVISLVFSAYITPHSSYLMRLSFYEMEIRGISASLENDGPTQFVRDVDNRTVISSGVKDQTAERGNLFVFQDSARGGWRFDQADDWRVVDEEIDTGFTVELNGFRTYTGFPAGASAADQQAVADDLSYGFGDAIIRVTRLFLDLRTEQILPVYDRNRLSHEVLFLGARSGEAGFGGAPTERMGKALARALLCPFAALMAVAGAAWSGTRIGRVGALPLTIVAVLGFDIVSRALMGDLALSGASVFWTTFGGISLCAMLLPMSYVLIRREQILIPSRGRA